MGFVGLGSVCDADGASDFWFGIVDSIQKAFIRELDNEGNQYNPPGFVNILLVLDEHPHLAEYLSYSFIKRLNYKISLYGEGNYPDPNTEKQYVNLVKNFRNNKAIKKALRSFK